MKEKIGKLRLIKAGKKIYSINNQTDFILINDTIIEIKQNCVDSDYIYVKPQEILFNMPGMIPGIISKGVDEWAISYNETEQYELPPPHFFN